MKIWDIVKTVGSAAIQVALPGTGSIIVGAVNAFLPDDKKLPATATGNDIGAAVSNMSPEDTARITEREFDVDIIQIKESNTTLRSMLESDAANPHSTRPYIAMHSFHVLAIVTVSVVGAWCYGVGTKDAALVKAVMEGWPFILAIVAPFVTLLRAYFGMLKTEHKNKLDAANGVSTPGGFAGILSEIFKRK